MNQRRKYNWPELFEQFDHSGLTQAEFCRQHNLDAKYFSQKRKQAQGSRSKASAFAKLTLQQAPSHSLPQSTATIAIEYGRCKIHCPNTLPMAEVVNLVRALA